MVLETLTKNQLLATLSKCQFGYYKVDYLGHLILAQEVKAVPSKIEVMLRLPIPKITKALRGFLVLMGYYRKL